MNYTAIDFETANNFRRSACSLGLVKVEEGQIVEKKYWLIKPTPLEVGFMQYKVHGIKLEMLINQPDFKELWQEIKPYLENQTLVAHNGKFDFNVLAHLINHYELENIPMTTYCTLDLSKIVWPNELAYNLASLVSEKLGVAFNHHNALEDAEVTALLFQQILKDSGVRSLEEINEFIDTNYFKISNRFRTSTPLGRRLNIELAENEAHPFFGKEVVFSGTFSAFTKEGGRELVAKIGGVPKESVTSNTKFLVVGQQDMYRVGLEMKSSKMKKVEQMISKGLDVQVLIEAEFIELLNC